jgi:hypothetical protein
MAIKRNLFRDVLRDTNSRKYSMTKLAAFTSLLLLVAAVGSGIGIMIANGEVDHILIGEIIALLLTLLGFKNFRGNFKSMDSGSNPQLAEPKPEEDERDELKEHENDEIG